MKSGKWTAAQNRAQEDEVVDSIGELVALCERDGFIPKFYSAGPQDHADRVIEDLQKYTRDLVDNEVGLSTMIEGALKQIEEEKERIKEAAELSEEDEEAQLFNYNTDDLLDDQDFSDFKDFEADLEDEDRAFYEALMQDYDEEDDE